MSFDITESPRPFCFVYTNCLASSKEARWAYATFLDGCYLLSHQFLVSPIGADTVQGIWCSGGLAGGGERASLAGQRPQTLWHVVQGVCVQGEDTAASLIHMAIIPAAEAMSSVVKGLT